VFAVSVIDDPLNDFKSLTLNPLT